MKYLKYIKDFLLESKGLEGWAVRHKLKEHIRNFEIKLKDRKLRKESLNDDNFNDIIKILERDCKDFINEIKKEKSLLYRGFKKIGSPYSENEEAILGLYKKQRKSLRMPLDVRTDLSDDLDDQFSNDFNFRLRADGVFVTKSPYTAESYSDSTKRKSYIFFPIGDYDYYWNPKIEDLFSYIEDKEWYRYYNQEEDFEWEYYNLYGDPRYYYSNWIGYFKLNGIKIERVFKLIDYIFDNYKEFGLEAPEDDKIKIGNDIISLNSDIKLISELKWVPEMTLDDFMEKIKFNKEDIIKDITEGYRSGGLNDIDLQEITFDCDYYYLVEEDYYFKLLDYLEN
jgi:hypothetical protein